MLRNCKQPSLVGLYIARESGGQRKKTLICGEDYTSSIILALSKHEDMIFQHHSCHQNPTPSILGLTLSYLSE